VWTHGLVFDAFDPVGRPEESKSMRKWCHQAQTVGMITAARDVANLDAVCVRDRAPRTLPSHRNKTRISSVFRRKGLVRFWEGEMLVGRPKHGAHVQCALRQNFRHNQIGIGTSLLEFCPRKSCTLYIRRTCVGSTRNTRKYS